MKMKKRLVFSAIYYAILCILFVREKRGWFLVIRNAIKFQSGEIERERERNIYIIQIEGIFLNIKNRWQRKKNEIPFV